MDFHKQGMKGPTRPAPAAPGFIVNRYSPVTNWNDDPFGSEVFEPNPQYAQKKKPPPRPPPPRVAKQPEVAPKPLHFIRRPTVLTSLLNRKNKNTVTANNKSANSNQTIVSDFSSEVDAHRMFPRCEPKNVNTGALIDLSSPPSSPTFTTRSSSDGLSVDSFGSDATTSTNHNNMHNGGNASQAESGFEDDFDLFMHSRKPISKEDTFDDFTTIDPFSPQPLAIKPPILKKPNFNRDLYDLPSSQAVGMLKGPTIIRAKPARPKPPDSSAILRSTFGNDALLATMNLNTTTPIQKITNGFGGFGDSFDSKAFCWDNEGSSERESSPPMPSIPPPPPPQVEDLEPVAWPDDLPEELAEAFEDDRDSESEPHAIALFDYQTQHPDDLNFLTNDRIKLIRRVDEEWLFGSLPCGAQGLFPSNFVEIKVHLPNEKVEVKTLGAATALYDFEPDQPGDLRFLTSDVIQVLYKINDEWYFGECNGLKGQFPVNYVQMS